MQTSTIILNPARADAVFPVAFADGYRLVKGPNGNVSVQSTEDESCFYSINLFLRGKWSPFTDSQRAALHAALPGVLAA